MRVLVDDLEEVVVAMRGAGETPYYMYGHRLELANRLLDKEDDKVLKYKKYPLVALRMDFSELNDPGKLVEYNLNIAFVTLTEEKYNAEERYTNVIKPILYPLVDLFFAKLGKVGLFTWDSKGIDRPRYTKIDRPYWGISGLESNEKNIFNDPLDAVELVDLKIRSTNKTC